MYGRKTNEYKILLEEIHGFHLHVPPINRDYGTYRTYFSVMGRLDGYCIESCRYTIECSGFVNFWVSTADYSLIS
jgi:hypothetical protein